MAEDLPQTLSQEEFGILTMNKALGGKNPLFLEPPKAAKNRESLLRFAFLLKGDNLGLRSGFMKEGEKNNVRLPQFEYFELEQADGSEKCYTYRESTAGEYRQVDQFTRKSGEAVVKSGDLDTTGTTLRYYSHGGKLICQTPLPP